MYISIELLKELGIDEDNIMDLSIYTEQRHSTNKDLEGLIDVKVINSLLRIGSKSF